MITKIISSGQGCIEQAALDVAKKMEIPHAGWVPETGAQPTDGDFPLKVIPSRNAYTHIEKNIRQAGGILILHRGKKTGSPFGHIKKTGKKLNKPLLFIDLDKISKFECSLSVNKWVTEENIQTIYITGYITGEPEKKETARKDVVDILESAFYLGHIEQSKPLSGTPEKTIENTPKTIDDAISCLLTELPLKDRVLIANMTYGELGTLNITLGAYIRDHFGVWTGNTALLESCRLYSENKNLAPENISMVIISALWAKLKQTHRLRVVRSKRPESKSRHTDRPGE